MPSLGSCSRKWLAAMILALYSPAVDAFAPSPLQSRAVRSSYGESMNQHFMSSGDGSEDEWVKGKSTFPMKLTVLAYLLISSSAT